MQDRIAAIMADTQAHGFKFVNGPVSKDGRSWPSQPLVEIVDGAKFDAAFPGKLLEYANRGVRIATQEDARSNDSHEAIKLAEVSRLLGIRSTGPALKFIAHGQKFATQAEADAYSEKVLAAKLAEMLKAQRK